MKLLHGYGNPKLGRILRGHGLRLNGSAIPILSSIGTVSDYLDDGNDVSFTISGAGSRDGGYIIPSADMAAGKPIWLASPTVTESPARTFTANTDGLYVHPKNDAPTLSYAWTKSGGAAGSGTQLVTDAYDDNRELGLTVSATNTSGISGHKLTARAAPPVSYFDGALYLQRSFSTKPTTAVLFRATFTWPTLTTGKVQYPLALNDGRTSIRIASATSVRVDLNASEMQYITTATLPVQPGDVVTIVSQLKLDGVSRPHTMYQINGNAPVLAGSKTGNAVHTFLDGTDLYVGRHMHGASSTVEYYTGKIYALDYWANPSVLIDTFTEAKMRDFINADGTVPGRSVTTGVYGNSAYGISPAPADMNAGTNPGTAGVWTVNGGTFAEGIASSWFDLSARTYQADLAAGSTVATIETDGNPKPSYSITGDAGGYYTLEGTTLKRSGTAITYTGAFHDLTITEMQQSGTRSRTFKMWAGQIGQDTLAGRVSISASRTSLYKDEHAYLELAGLTDEEAALLDVVWDFGDAAEVYQNVRAGHTKGTQAQIKRGPQVLHTFTGTTGTRTVNVSIYRPGNAVAVWTGSVNVEVKDPASITLTQIHVVAKDGDFTGAPTSTANYTSITAALDAAVAQQNNGTDAIVYLKRGETWLDTDANGDNNFSVRGLVAGAKALLIRPWGTGANPIVTFRGDSNGGNWKSQSWGLNGTFAGQASVSVVDIDFHGLFDAYNIQDANGVGTHNKRASALGGNLAGHYTVTRSNSKALMMFSSDADKAELSQLRSQCLHDCKVDEWIPYAYYMGYGKMSGLDGGIYVKSPGQPLVSKERYAIENPTDTFPLSVNGPGRVGDAESIVVSRGQYAGFHGWSNGNTAPQLKTTYPNMNLPAHQPTHRMASAQDLVAGGKVTISDCEFEGEFALASPDSNWGRFVVARNYFLAHAGAVELWTMDHRGTYWVSNICVISNVLPESGNSRRFLQIDTVNNKDKSFVNADATHYRHHFVGNTFIDLRTSGNLSSGETGSISELMGDLKKPYVRSVNNIVYVPNRTVTDPGLPGLTVVTGAAALTSDVIMAANYAGLCSPTPGNYNPFVTPVTDTTYATPTTSGWSGKLATGSALDNTWTAAPFPAYDFGGNRLTTATRAPGAWENPA